MLQFVIVLNHKLRELLAYKFYVLNETFLELPETV